LKCSSSFFTQASVLGSPLIIFPPRQKRGIWTTDEVVDPLLEVARPRHLWSNRSTPSLQYRPRRYKVRTQHHEVATMLHNNITYCQYHKLLFSLIDDLTAPEMPAIRFIYMGATPPTKILHA
jgi:hypothetical protein